MADHHPSASPDVDAFRAPPYSLDAEMCLLASMMLDRDVAIEAAGSIQAAAFHLADNGIIFDTIAGLVRERRPVDAVILRDELRTRGQLDAIGGSAYIGRILDKVPSAAHGREYLRRVAELSAMRASIAVHENAIRRLYARDGAAAEIAGAAVGELMNVAAGGAADRIVTMAQAVEGFRVDLASGREPFVRTGFADLDEEIGGVGIGKMTIIGARPSVGKTAVAKIMLRNIAARGVRCGFVSIEEQRGKIIGNYAASISAIDNRIIAHRALSPSQAADVQLALDELATLPIFLSDEPVRLEDVVAAITAMRVRHACEVVVVDHLHLIDIASDDSRADQIRRISGTLKSTFKRLDVAGVVLCQLNREGNERPTLRSLREGGALEQDGDVVVMLHREDYHRRQRGDTFRDNKLEMLLQKNKDGPCADIPFFFDPAKFRVGPWGEHWIAAGAAEDPDPLDALPFSMS